MLLHILPQLGPTTLSGGKSGTAPSALLAFGQNNVEALRSAGIAGAFFPKAEMLSGTKASKF